MNDFISPILKLLSTLVSARAAVRYVCIGFTLIFSWVKIKPVIDTYNLPIQISGFASTLIGVGSGALIAFLILFLFDTLALSLKISREKKNKIEDLIRQKELEEKENNTFAENFKNNIHHYKGWYISILEKLCKGNTLYHTTPQKHTVEKVNAIRSLHSNKIILKVLNVGINEDVYTINPLLRDWLTLYFRNRKIVECKDFLENLTTSRYKALELLEDTKNKSHILPREFDDFKRHYLPCIDYETSGETFYFKFHEGYRDVFEEVTGKKFLDRVEGSIDG